MGKKLQGYGVVRMKWGEKGTDQYRKTSTAYHRKYIKDPVVAARIRKQIARRAEGTRETILAAKDKGCTDCGRWYPPYVLDFDHVRGTKIDNISHARFLSAPRKLREEIAKCEVVCANCHREREHKRRMRVKA
jgi:hypothetical protein